LCLRSKTDKPELFEDDLFGKDDLFKEEAATKPTPVKSVDKESPKVESKK